MKILNVKDAPFYVVQSVLTIIILLIIIIKQFIDIDNSINMYIKNYTY